MDEYTDGWEAHKERIRELVETMQEDGFEVKDGLEELLFRMEGL